MSKLTNISIHYQQKKKEKKKKALVNLLSSKYCLSDLDSLHDHNFFSACNVWYDTSYLSDCDMNFNDFVQNTHKKINTSTCTMKTNKTISVLLTLSTPLLRVHCLLSGPVLQVTYCFASNMMPFFPNSLQDREQPSSCTVPKRIV